MMKYGSLSPSGVAIRRARTVALALALAGGMTPAAAQDDAEARVRRLEAEVRALQRKVFPGGAGGQTFSPEISAPATVTAAPGAPATSAVTDILTRLDALEAQIARITAQGEQNGNRLAQIEARLGPAPTSPEGPPSAAPVASPLAGPPPETAPPAPDTAASASRLEAVRAVPRPQTADAGDDAYSYGYRLWEAKFYPEAEQQLRLYLRTYPQHARVSFARNLLGRAYLAEGDAREAAKWFLQNYQADKAGARAPDSLLYLGLSMKRIGDGKRACVAVAEFASSYPAEAAGRLKADYDDTRKGLSCAA